MIILKWIFKNDNIKMYLQKMIILKWIIKKCNLAWTELVWLKIRTGGGLL
jgi:hypothetical protein